MNACSALTRFHNLGGGILEGRDPITNPTATIDGIVRHRFMDRLYLPAPTNKLEVEAIVAINRWREHELSLHEFPHRNRVRRVALAAIKASAPTCLLEIGCGKFPLSDDHAFGRYYGLEIDGEAIRDNERRGIRTFSHPSEIGEVLPEIDTVAALFTLQFKLSVETIDCIRHLSPSTVMFMNVPTRDERLVTSRIDMLRSLDLTVTVITLPHTEVNDVLLISGGPASAPRMESMTAAASRQVAVEWPAVCQSERSTS